MDQQVAQESYRAGRYLAVRVISRGGDVVIFLFLLWLWGKEWLVPAFVISASFNYITDFFGQKLWTFKNLDTRPKEIAKEFGFYFFIRAGNIACAGALWWLLYIVVGLHWIIASSTVLVVFWTIVFGLYRYLFIGSLSDLLELIRSKFKTRSS